MALLISLVVLVASEFVLGLFVLLKNKSSLVHRCFFGFSIAAITWAISNYLTDELFSMFWMKMTFVGSSFIALFLVLFSYYLEPKEKRKWILWFTIASTFISVLIIWIPDLFIKGIDKYTYGSISGSNIVNGKMYIYYPIYFFILSVLSVWLLAKKHKHVEGVRKIQLRYFLVGLVMGLLIGYLCNALIPLITGNYLISRFGPYGSIFYAVLTSYAIVRYRFLDIKVIIRRSVIYLTTVAISVLLYVLLIYALQNILTAEFTFRPERLAIITALLIILGVPFIQKGAKKLVEKVFKKEAYDPQRILTEFEQKTQNKNHSFDVIEETKNILKQNLGLESVRAIIQNPLEMGKWQDEKGGAIELPNNNPLFEYLRVRGETIIIKEELPYISQGLGENQELIKNATEWLAKQNAEAAVILANQSEIIGLLLFGKRSSGAAFSVQDIDFLRQFQIRLSLILANVFLYEKTINRITSMEK